MTWALLLLVLAPPPPLGQESEIVHVTASYHLTEADCRKEGEKIYQQLRDLGRRAKWECKQVPAP